MKRLPQLLTATGRRLRIFAKVICHFFQGGKLALKLAIKIPFIEIGISFELGRPRREPLRRLPLIMPLALVRLTCSGYLSEPSRAGTSASSQRQP